MTRGEAGTEDSAAPDSGDAAAAYADDAYADDADAYGDDADAYGDDADGGAGCALRADRSPDFTMELLGTTRNVQETFYEGPAAVTRTDAADLELLGQDGTRATFGGRVPVVPPGASLWVKLQSAWWGNPINPWLTYDLSVSAAEGAPPLAETVLAYVPAQPGTVRSFLGAPLSFSRICEGAPYGQGYAIGQPRPVCLQDRGYSVTIHGDQDVTLTVASPARVTIAGVEYEVWVSRASDTEILVDQPSLSTCLTPDTDPAPGLSISGRAVDFDRLLRSIGGDGGAADSGSGADASG